MSKVTITIDCDNAAFSDGAGPEIARILHKLADLIEYEQEPSDSLLFDHNGNRVGKFEFEADEEDSDEEE